MPSTTALVCSQFQQDFTTLRALFKIFVLVNSLSLEVFCIQCMYILVTSDCLHTLPCKMWSYSLCAWDYVWDNDRGTRHSWNLNLRGGRPRGFRFKYDAFGGHNAIYTSKQLWNLFCKMRYIASAGNSWKRMMADWSLIKVIFLSSKSLMKFRWACSPCVHRALYMTCNQ